MSAGGASASASTLARRPSIPRERGGAALRAWRSPTPLRLPHAAPPRMPCAARPPVARTAIRQAMDQRRVRGGGDGKQLGGAVEQAQRHCVRERELRLSLPESVDGSRRRDARRTIAKSTPITQSAPRPRSRRIRSPCARSSSRCPARGRRARSPSTHGMAPISEKTREAHRAASSRCPLAARRTRARAGSSAPEQHGSPRRSAGTSGRLASICAGPMCTLAPWRSSSSRRPPRPTA